MQPGDSFIVAHEQQYQDGEFVRDGDILAAEFVNPADLRAVRYVAPDGRMDYYTPDGRPVRKAFLRYPVDYAPHQLGLQLSAPPPGPESRARAQGHRLRRADRHADQGGGRRPHRQPRQEWRLRQCRRARAQQRRHHAVRPHVAFRQGPRVGDRVQQGQVIGYVGMTGLATGPHVHYEYRVNGVHKNPAKVTIAKADPIPARLMADFQAQTAPLLARLDAPAAPAGAASRKSPGAN